MKEITIEELCERKKLRLYRWSYNPFTFDNFYVEVWKRSSENAFNPEDFSDVDCIVLCRDYESDYVISTVFVSEAVAAKEFIIWIQDNKFYEHCVNDWDIKSLTRFHEMRVSGVSVEDAIGFIEL